MDKFRGIFPALLTPFTKDGQVNHKVLRELVEMNIAKGVKGFYACGSTGEAFLLSVTERKQILETIVDQTKGRGTIIAHIGSISTDQAIDLAQHASGCGVDAISSIPPFYYGYSFAEIRQYYFDIVDSMNTPMIIYNFPANSGVKLTEENIRAFLDDPRFIGVKHTSNDFYLLERLKSAYDNIVVFNGYDEMFLSGLAAGADGGIGSTFNFMAEKFIAIQTLFKQNKVSEAQQIQAKANRIIAALIKVGVMPAEKAALCMMGLDFGECRRPFKKVSQEEYAYLEKIIAENS